MSRWVQYKNDPNGQKWELCIQQTGIEHDGVWAVRMPGKLPVYLPKSEYAFVDPPEQWEDVTSECEAIEVTIGGETCIAHGGIRVESNYFKSYRFRKIDGLHHGPAFIIERKKS